jgi:hypothetical protein
MANDVRDLSKPKGQQGGTTPPTAQPPSPQRVHPVLSSSEKNPGGSGSVVSPARDWLRVQEEYLEIRGWERAGTNERGVGIWRDPKGRGQKSELKEAVVLPVQGGGREVVKQLYLPPADWYFTTEEASQLQHQRDEGGEGLRDVVEYRRRELKELEEQLAKQNRSAVAGTV